MSGLLTNTIPEIQNTRKPRTKRLK